jgi:hypothetical protein
MRTRNTIKILVGRYEKKRVVGRNSNRKGIERTRDLTLSDPMSDLV